MERMMTMFVTRLKSSTTDLYFHSLNFVIFDYRGKAKNVIIVFLLYMSGNGEIDFYLLIR